MRGNANIAGIVSLVLALGSCSVHAVDDGFEQAQPSGWLLQYGGDGGGAGGARVVHESAMVRSGAQAVELSAESSGHSSSRAWASVSRMVRCEGAFEVTLAAWLRRSAPAGADVRMLVEYFEDEEARLPVVQKLRIVTAPPAQAGTWQEARATERVPDRARFARVSVVLVADSTVPSVQRIWVDDFSVAQRLRPARRP